jgi:hypothetical protein
MLKGLSGVVCGLVAGGAAVVAEEMRASACVRNVRGQSGASRQKSYPLQIRLTQSFGNDGTRFIFPIAERPQ